MAESQKDWELAQGLGLLLAYGQFWGRSLVVMLKLYLLMKLVREEMFICHNTLVQGSLSQIGKEI